MPFEAFVNELSDDERRTMLKKIHPKDKEDTAAENEQNLLIQNKKINIEERFKKLSLIDKIVLYIKAFFNGQTVLDTYKHNLLRKMADSINQNLPGLINIKKWALGPAFCQRMRQMDEYLRLINPVLSDALGENSKDFYAFLALKQMSWLDSLIKKEGNPFYIAKESDNKTPDYINKKVSEEIESALKQVSHDQKKVIEAQINFLNALYRLSCFPISEKFPHCFHPAAEKSGQSIDFDQVENGLEKIGKSWFNSLSYNFIELFPVLVLYQNKDRVQSLMDLEKDENQNLKKEIHNKTKQVEEVFKSLKNIEHQLNLISLVKLAKRNLNYFPERETSGYSWFNNFTDLILHNCKQNCRKYQIQYQLQILRDNAAELCGQRLEKLPNYHLRTVEIQKNKKLQFKFQNTMSFIYSFIKTAFLKKIYLDLNVIVLEGDFYRKDNKEGLTDCLNYMKSSLDKMEAFSLSLSEKGNRGFSLNRLINQSSWSNEDIYKMKEIIINIDNEMERFVRVFSQNLTLTTNILKGLLFGQPGEDFDSLINLNQIKGKSNHEFRVDLESDLGKLNSAENILHGFFDIEIR